jgi:hypothetical protein
MPNSRNRFRERFGVSPDQHYLLSNVMKEETITRDQLGNNAVQQMHRLVGRGLMTHAPSTTSDPYDDSWRLTEAGRNLLKHW